MTKITQLAALACAAVSGLSAAQEDPKFLTKQEVETTFSGKVIRFIRPRDGNTIRWDIRSGGQLFHSNETRAGGGTSVSGSWEAKEDGGLCVRMRDNPTEVVCTYYYFDAGKLKRTFARTAESAASAVTIEFKD